MKKTIKMIIVLLCLFTVAGLTSCSNGSDSKIVGSWELVKTEYTDEGGTLVTNDNIDEVWTFKSNGACYRGTHANPTRFGHIWVIDNDRLVISDYFPYTIEKLNSNEMCLLSEEFTDLRSYFKKMK
jgi:hypothetical protein